MIKTMLKLFKDKRGEDRILPRCFAFGEGAQCYSPRFIENLNQTIEKMEKIRGISVSQIEGGYQIKYKPDGIFGSKDILLEMYEKPKRSTDGLMKINLKVFAHKPTDITRKVMDLLEQ